MALFCEYASLSLTSPIVLSTVQRIDCLVAQMNGVGRVKKEEEVEPSWYNLVYYHLDSDIINF